MSADVDITFDGVQLKQPMDLLKIQMKMATWRCLHGMVE
jgi:hypothetical protein